MRGQIDVTEAMQRALDGKRDLLVDFTGAIVWQPCTFGDLYDAKVKAMLAAYFTAFEDSVRRQIEAHNAKLAAMTKKERRHYLRLHNPPPRRGRR